MQNKILTKEHLYINQVKETVELTNVVKIPRFSIFNKNRFAVLTTQRLLIFEDKEAFLLKKACKDFFEIKRHDFDLSKTDLIIRKLREDNERILKLDKLNLKDVDYLIVTIKFPSIELCNQWWETIKFFKVKMYEEEKIKLKLKRNFKLNLHQGAGLSAKNLTNKTNKDYVDPNYYKNTLDKHNGSKKDFEKITDYLDNNTFENDLKKTLFPPRKSNYNCLSIENDHSKKIPRKIKLNNSYDERIDFKRNIHAPNSKEFEINSKKDSQDEYLKRIKAYFNHDRNENKDNNKDQKFNKPNQLYNNTNESMRKSETLPLEISKTYSMINAIPNKCNPVCYSKKSNIEKIFDKDPNKILSQGRKEDDSFRIFKKNENHKKNYCINEQKEKGSLKLKTNQDKIKNLKEIKKSEKKFSEQKFKGNLENRTKYINLEDVNIKNNSGKSDFLEKEFNNPECSDVYNYTKYKEIPTNSNFPIQDYFKRYISNNIAGKKSSEDKAKTKKKMIRTQFEILSKNISASHNKQEKQLDEYLYDNQNKLKNKLSFRLKPINIPNYDNRLRHQSISLTYPIFSEENVTQSDFSHKDLGESKNTESNYALLNETVKIRNPIGSLMLENKLGEGFEENFVDLKKLNDKIKYKDKKILNSNEIKSKIAKLELSKDFENIQNNIVINSFAYINKSHDDHRMFEGIKSDKRSRNSNNFEKQNKESSDCLNIATINANKNINSKRNLIVLKMLRGHNNKSADFGLSVENGEINLNKSIDDKQMFLKRNKIPQQVELNFNLGFDYKNILYNNPEKDNKSERIIPKEKESQSALNLNRDSSEEQNDTYHKKSSKIPNGSEKKIHPNNKIIEKDSKVNNNKRANINIEIKESDKCNSLLKSSKAVETFHKEENKPSCISSNHIDHKINDLDLNNFNCFGNNSYDHYYQNGDKKNLMNLHSNRYCFYCFRGQTTSTSNSSHQINNMHKSISLNTGQMNFSKYPNKEVFDLQYLENNDKFNNQENYFLNEKHNDNFLKSQRDQSISLSLKKEPKEIGIREFYNKQKQNVSSSNGSINLLSTDKKSRNNKINNNTLNSNEKNVINHFQKDFCHSKIWNNLNKSLKFFEGNEKQLDEIFNCDSVISFSKKYHIKNELKKSFPCNFCWQYLQSLNHKSQDRYSFDLENRRRNNNIDTNKQNEVFLIRDINSEKNKSDYINKRMDIINEK